MGWVARFHACQRTSMPAQSRFNLAALRTVGQRSKTPAKSWLDELQISRRRFLGFSAAAGAGAAIPPFLRGEGFSTVCDGSKIDVLVRNESRWTIDATKFGPAARVGILKTDGRLKLTLVDAVFPGTEIPANFEAILVKR